MKKIKSLLILPLLIVCAFCLAACGNDDESSSKKIYNGYNIVGVEVYMVAGRDFNASSVELVNFTIQDKQYNNIEENLINNPFIIEGFNYTSDDQVTSPVNCNIDFNVRITVGSSISVAGSQDNYELDLTEQTTDHLLYSGQGFELFAKITLG